MESEDQLRAWAKGSYPYEAATELLLRGFEGRFTSPGFPWMKLDDDSWWIDFEAIPNHLGTMSGGEKRFLLLVASLSGETPVVLGDVLPGLDRDLQKLVMAAVAHAAGSHEAVETIIDGDRMSYEKVGSLYPWPEEESTKPRLRLVDND